MYLITGATGSIGRPLVEALLADGKAVRAISRNPSAAGLPAGTEVVQGDARKPGPHLLDGITALFVHPRAVGEEAAGKLVTAAAEQGVRRVVVMSAINVDEELDHQPSRYNGDRNKEVEQAVVRGPLPWVSVRPTSFALNTLTMWAGQIRAGNVVRGPYAGFAEALVHEKDVAETIARALRDEAFTGRYVPVSGPHNLTHSEAVATIGRAIGRPLRYEEIPAEAAAQGMIRSGGLPEPFVRALMARYERGEKTPARATSATGAPGRTFAQWATEHATDFTGADQ
ncbi:nucleotide-diphosphate-sugar epimerase [Streptomyces longisporoflavus]|uniref:SDR family oxidoreductase n=1 Tax=Streptomyces longisporoflavus TaxID=28044 RepID=UPI00167D5DE2|nr:NAD(P)H-binding protein [Streptomyces longisporoflavus]GGV66380.1 nucleotide-diphosphate-sugar epimerase [Streptomyces longisporoflavus]